MEIWVSYENLFKWGEAKLALDHYKYRPDGILKIDNSSQIPFEVYGCKTHTCIIHRHKPHDIHPLLKISYEKLEEREKNRLKSIKLEYGIEPCVIYMCQFIEEYEKPSGKYYNKYIQFLKERPDLI